MFSSSLRPTVRTVDARVRRAVTIVEIMIATVVSLLLILAVMQGFQVIATTVTDNRSLLEMSGRLRLAMQNLQEDLEGATCTGDYRVTLADGVGYFEVLEGRRSDADNDGDGVADYQDPADSNGDGVADYLATYRGDPDDILMFTTRRTNEPFLGRVPRPSGVNIETGYVAEVAYWTSIDDLNQNGSFDFGEELMLHRRVLLVRPDLNDAATGFIPGTAPLAAGSPANLGNVIHAMYQQLVQFQNVYDVSARVAVSKTNPLLVGISANSLSDLSRRGSRFAHVSHVGALEINGGPFTLIPASAQISYPIETPGDFLHPRYQMPGDYAGEDVIANNIVAFDVRLFDPGAPIRALPGPDGAWGVAGVDDDGNGTVDDPSEAGMGDDEVVRPGDPGWFFTGVAIGTGAYVDLNYTRQGLPGPPANGQIAPIRGSAFSGLPNYNASLRFLGVIPDLVSTQFTYYDQWLFDNEADGYDQDADGLTDEGTNFLDDDGANGVDDPGEYETSAPYPVRLRGIEVSVRMIEPNTRQLRQSTISVDFVK